MPFSQRQKNVYNNLSGERRGIRFPRLSDWTNKSYNLGADSVFPSGLGPSGIISHHLISPFSSGANRRQNKPGDDTVGDWVEIYIGPFLCVDVAVVVGEGGGWRVWKRAGEIVCVGKHT